MTAKSIVNILWTYSWGGFTIQCEDGSNENLTPTQLCERVGRSEYERLSKIAHQFPCNCFKSARARDTNGSQCRSANL